MCRRRLLAIITVELIALIISNFSLVGFKGGLLSKNNFWSQIILRIKYSRKILRL